MKTVVLVHTIVVFISMSDCSTTNGSDHELEPMQFGDSESCPLWMYWNTWTGKCSCNSAFYDSVVKCDSDHMQVAVLFGYCITHSLSDKIIVGACPYNQLSYTSEKHYYYLPLNTSQVDSAMCGNFSRKGQLCGDCIDGHSIPVYTYYPQCVSCTNGTNNWGKYIAVSIVPQTVFFVTVLALGLRATSPSLNGFILYSQLITPPPVLRTVATMIYNFRNDPSWGPNEPLLKLIAAMFSFHSIWNMDFFRLDFEPFCLHPDASTLQILALDYIIAAYPLIVIIVIYVLVQLYYRNWTPIVWMWKPFQKCSRWFNRRWNIDTPLLDAFATFLLLSYIKFLSVSFTLLFPAVIYLPGKEPYHTYLYYASTTKYMGTEHLPYALLAIVNLTIFTLLPILLLCLYPCRCFQRCLNRYHLSFQALHIIMDIFQGSYKNGTDGTKDYRYFAAGNLILMTAVYFSLIGQMLFLKYWATFGIILLFLAIFSICKPFKDNKYNNLHIMWLTPVLIFYGVTSNLFMQSTYIERDYASLFVLLFVCIPPLCIAYVGVRLIYLCWKYCCVAMTRRCRHDNMQEEPELDSLLIENRGDYNSLA